MALTPEQIKQFNEDGYLILPDFYTHAECDVLRERIQKLIHEQLDLSNHPRTIFSTSTQTNDNYFLNSGDKIAYFFEEQAFDAAGNLAVPVDKSLNKIGHALHELDPDFKKFTTTNKVKELTRSVGFKRPVVAQSMYIFKQAGIGGEVVPHQDSTFLHTSPCTIMGFWVALENCDLDNGCLWFVPGSQKDGLHRRFVRDASGTGTLFTAPAVMYPDDKFIPGIVQKGGLVLIHGEIIHRSGPNNTSRSRNIYTWHVMETENVAYSQDNWLQPEPKMTLYDA
ncbi:phytanoyl-CoA dioxygenase domain-containing protein 1 [Capsaspora owczarzaki ATCC 30864]|uniref:Phytanoyl-CoA dioxygenase domain-containing protein 1 n=1 Tax=Capsaspora owczarzaki (strain ATCC 30864) TaxID=595528 RepID=A0A0D2X3W0_CAPO3|nr:phytanoyl-CoA dioxygenase domain-containing protein 1 [Capsaspora owczarzaki ATCC 30864]KJE94994.1 phytanoyl-CoA dioxygenase domain-containing protein 1 [Capsaspora owczarzaki ATCC 30864]|eukprot:XP_004346198.1 phytanoyl-CoA dioxygenase domain-containing protein 1 [Capsaspora owczarzaki ATCC 30864]